MTNTNETGSRELIKTKIYDNIKATELHLIYILSFLFNNLKERQENLISSIVLTKTIKVILTEEKNMIESIYS